MVTPTAKTHCIGRRRGPPATRQRLRLGRSLHICSSCRYLAERKTSRQTSTVPKLEWTVPHLGFQGEPGAEVECQGWGGCRDPRPFTILGTGQAPVGVPVGANGWRCSKSTEYFDNSLPRFRIEVIREGNKKMVEPGGSILSYERRKL